VLAADFHVHPAILSAGALAPWDLALEARRQGLDVLAITPHNQVFTALFGRRVSRALGWPLVLAGEEVRSPAYHLIAVGIRHRVSWDQPAADAIADVHRQGGVAIAAHPVAAYWRAYDARAMADLDGAEVLHPVAYLRADMREEMEGFFARKEMTAIGSSDYHGLGRLGLCRTFVFVDAATEAAVLDALRARRTLVYDRDGRVHGDPELARLAAADGRLAARANPALPGGPWHDVNRAAAVLALVAVVAVGLPAAPRQSASA